MTVQRNLSIPELRAGYLAKQFTVLEVIWEVLAGMGRSPEQNIWIGQPARDVVLEYARKLVSRSPESLPLYGIPFAVKDNIDVEGMPTTAGCAAFQYAPQRSASVVRKLMEAGAIPVGKTNLDQFATGLTGTRSPYGACRNTFNPEYISGGSSSGSAVAVASGYVSFSLGTDTAGSGRVPAAFNNLVGVKPTLGRLSTRGVVPACRSLDCVSVFALTVEDAALVMAVAEGPDAEDPFSRPIKRSPLSSKATGAFRFATPHVDELEFFGDSEYARLFFEAVQRLEQLGGTPAEIDFKPYRSAARLLYDGPWIAERYAGVGDFLESQPQAVFPLTMDILSAGVQVSGADVYRGHHRLMQLRRAAEAAWGDADIFVTPTAGTIYRLDDVEGDPIRLNTNLGYYTNFVNLLDLAAVAVPAGFRSDGLPFGVTLIGRAGTDRQLLQLAARFQRSVGIGRLGATRYSLSTALPDAAAEVRDTSAEDAPVNDPDHSDTDVVDGLEDAPPVQEDVDPQALIDSLAPDAADARPANSLTANASRIHSAPATADDVSTSAAASAGAVDHNPSVATSPSTENAPAPATADEVPTSTATSAGAVDHSPSVATSPSTENAPAPATADNASTSAATSAGAVDHNPSGFPISTIEYAPRNDSWVSIAVCGAHMEGLPLNHQLLSRGGRLLQRTRTAPAYKFYALPGGPPFRPGLIRATKNGAAIDVEVWTIPTSTLGSFIAAIPAPLGLGRIELESGEHVTGFLCETYATENAEDITAMGNWRRYLSSKMGLPPTD